MNNSIEIYRSQDGSVQLNVKLENETVWLTQSQMAELFGRDRTVITRHINNCYKEGELDRHITCAKFAHMGKDQDQTYETTMYNLDVIISVGYRVKSVQGTRFRQWATSVLKQYLIKGYAINQQIKLDRYNELKDIVRLMSRAVGLQDKVTTDEYSGLFNVISDYVYALDTLDQYDYQSLSISKTTKEEPFRAIYSFKSSIGQIYQTFGGEELYPSVEEKAAMLLYLVVKNHSFSDGNKRIAAMLFLWFLNNNRVLYAEDGHKRIADNTLVALTLMIAESRTEEKDVMVKVVVINRYICTSKTSFCDFLIYNKRLYTHNEKIN